MKKQAKISSTTLRPQGKICRQCIVYSTLFWLLFISTGFSGKPKSNPVLVICPPGKQFEDVYQGLSDELGDVNPIFRLTLVSSTTVNSISQKIDEIKPKIAVLMDNRSVKLFRAYQSTLPDSKPKIPVISMMGVLVERLTSGMSNVRNISYEIPLVTAAVNMRLLMKKPITKIGVIHRHLMSSYIDANKAYCKSENISIFTEVLSDKLPNYKKAVKKSLNRLIKKNDIDALWVPNDYKLLQPKIIQKAWLPIIQRAKIPVIVGVEILVHPTLNFGTFAVLPDHLALGYQAAQLIYEAKENMWNFGDNQTFLPISVYKILNYRQASQIFELNVTNLEIVDKILK